MNRIKVTARTWDDGAERLFEVQGQTAKTLAALIESGDHGCTAQEVSSWAYRFAAYCWDLRHRYGLDIQTIREAHHGGWHGRHVLITPVEIVLVEPSGKIEA